MSDLLRQSNFRNRAPDPAVAVRERMNALKIEMGNPGAHRAFEILAAVEPLHVALHFGGHLRRRRGFIVNFRFPDGS